MSNPTRDRIVEAADQLIYQQGYEHTSFADIADIVKISRGNFYYHFKTKDKILHAVIDKRLEDTQKILDEWESKAEDPADRIKSYIHILLTNWDDIKYFGCPVGTLCTELAKLNHTSQKGAGRVFTKFRIWLRQQFTLLGHKKNADFLAMHILTWSQGVATMACTFQDEKFVKTEVRQVCDWLDTIIKKQKAF